MQDTQQQLRSVNSWLNTELAGQWDYVYLAGTPPVLQWKVASIFVLEVKHLDLLNIGHLPI